MLSGFPPFNGNNNKEVIQAVIKNQLHFNHPAFENVSFESKSLIEKMLTKNPNHRISLKEVIDHPMFSSVQSPLSNTLDNSDLYAECLMNYKNSNHLTKAFRIKMTKLYEGMNEDI